MPRPFSLNAGKVGKNDNVEAQYLVTVHSWWGTHRRLLTISPTRLAFYDANSLHCSRSIRIDEIDDAVATSTRDEMQIRLTKNRLIHSTLTIKCPARNHILATLHQLRASFDFRPVQSRLILAKRPGNYTCTQVFADGSSEEYLLQIRISGIVLMDDAARRVASIDYIHMHNLARCEKSYKNDGFVLSTIFHERLFRCSQREDCLDHIVTAAGSIGTTIQIGTSATSVPLLRSHHSQLLDRTAVAGFDARKISHDGSCETDVRIILQPKAIVEVLPNQRDVISRPYRKLRLVIHSDWKKDAATLEFVQGEYLAVKMDGCESFVSLLLLVCSERGYDHIELIATPVKSNRLFHPHLSENAKAAASSVMQMFHLQRLLQVPADEPESEDFPALLEGTDNQSHSQERRSFRSKGKKKTSKTRKTEKRYTGEDGQDDSALINAGQSLQVAMEEFNANFPVKGGFGKSYDVSVVNEAIENLVLHLSVLVSVHTRAETSPEIATTLQALVRLCHIPHATVADAYIPKLLEAVSDLFARKETLTCYWSLKLLQCFLKTDASMSLDDQVAQSIVHDDVLLRSLIHILPSASYPMPRSSGYWLLDAIAEDADADTRASTLQNMLFSKEARIERTMSIAWYETLLVLHYIVLFLHNLQQEAQSEIRDSMQKAANASRKERQQMLQRTNECHNQEQRAAQTKRAFVSHLMEKFQFLMDSVADMRLLRCSRRSISLIKVLLEQSRSDDMKRNPKRRRSFSDLSENNGTKHPRVANGNDEKRVRMMLPFELEEESKEESRDVVPAFHHDNRRSMSESELALAVPDCEDKTIDALTSSRWMPQPSESEQLETFLARYYAEVASSHRTLMAAPQSDRTRSSDDEDMSLDSSSQEEDKFFLDYALQNFSPVTRSSQQPRLSLDIKREMQNHKRELGRLQAKSFDGNGTGTAAHHCNACIHCNDVCDNPRCFFCCEKEYRLRASCEQPKNKQPRSAPSKYRDIELESIISRREKTSLGRVYSTCEVRRHLRKESCWIVAFHSVYDITPLLDIYPWSLGLFRLSKLNKNCGEACKELPSEARKILKRCRIGDFASCQKFTDDE